MKYETDGDLFFELKELYRAVQKWAVFVKEHSFSCDTEANRELVAAFKKCQKVVKE